MVSSEILLEGPSKPTCTTRPTAMHTIIRSILSALSTPRKILLQRLLARRSACSCSMGG